MDDDSEIDTVVITYHPRRLPFSNVDTHRLQESLISQILSQEFEQTEAISLPFNTCVLLEMVD